MTGSPDGPGALFEHILQAVGEGVLGVDARGTVTFANPAAERLLGYGPGELAGLPHHEALHRARPGGAPYPAERCPIHATLHDGLVHHVSGEVFWRKDGTELPVEYTSAPIREGGRITGAAIVFTLPSGRSDGAGAATDAVERPLVRRILQDLVDTGNVPHNVLTQVGRKTAADTDSRTMDGYVRAFEQMGLGRVRVEREEGQRVSFTGSDLLEHRPGSRVVTCAFTLGYLAEVVSRMHGNEPTLGSEIECQSRGAKECRFVVQVKKPEDSLARRVKELI